MAGLDPYYPATPYRLLCICGGLLLWQVHIDLDSSLSKNFIYADNMVLRMDSTLEFSHVGIPSEFCEPYKQAVIFLLEKEHQERAKYAMRTLEETLSRNLHGL